jgi:hypothetical protein
MPMNVTLLKGGVQGFMCRFWFFAFGSLQKNVGVRISPHFSVPPNRRLGGNWDKPFLIIAAQKGLLRWFEKIAERTKQFCPFIFFSHET